MRTRLVVLLGTVLVAGPALGADARFQFLGKQLEKATDPRARAQAALMLGQYADPTAVPMLCKGLSDKEDVVKAASAKALDLVGDLSAIQCLKTAAAQGGAQSAISTALRSLESVQNIAPKLYISLAPPDNRAGLSSELVTLLQERLKARLLRLGAIFAPPDEAAAAAAKTMKAKKLQGVMLMTTVDSAGAGISVTLVCLSYPDKILKGQVSVKAAGGQHADLIRALVPKAVEDAADEFEWGE